MRKAFNPPPSLLVIPPHPQAGPEGGKQSGDPLADLTTHLETNPRKRGAPPYLRRKMETATNRGFFAKGAFLLCPKKRLYKEICESARKFKGEMHFFRWTIVSIVSREGTPPRRSTKRKPNPTEEKKKPHCLSLYNAV